MSITKQSPRTVHLNGNVQAVNDVKSGGAITPGMLIERYNDSGTPKFRAHSTAGGYAVPTVALNQSILNKGVDDAYAAGDLVESAVFRPGSTAWMLIASGQTIVNGDLMASAGNGTLRKVAGADVPRFSAIENVTAAFTGYTRVKVECL